MQQEVHELAVSETALIAQPYVYIRDIHLLKVTQQVCDIVNDYEVLELQEDEVISYIFNGLFTYFQLTDSERNLVEPLLQLYAHYDTTKVAKLVHCTFKRYESLYYSRYYTTDTTTEILCVHESTVHKALQSVVITDLERQTFKELKTKGQHIVSLCFLYLLGIQY